ncbi:MAG: fatty acid desaturase, partial [Myxococcales bacterium]|nr:fatty acid desaturase [Myxococcales bacterium]
MSKQPPIWKRHSRHIAWPTVVLSVALIAGYGLVVWSALTERLPLLPATALLTLLAYVAFTPLHEATHQNVSGGVRGWRWLDPAVGWAMGLLFASPFPAFRAVHLRHHGRTNHLGDDPDGWVAGAHWWSIIARCFTILPHYHWVYLSRLMRATPASRREGRWATGALLVVGVVTVGAVWSGHGAAIISLWLAPAWLASGALAFAFDWLPHVPHQRIGRYVDTRAIDVRVLDVVLLGQNLHSVHHLYPRVPFYRYRTVFDAMAPEMMAKGTEVWR